MNKPIIQAKAIKFYRLVELCLKGMAKSYNIKNLERYYNLTDLRNENLKTLNKNSIELAFAQFAMHAQNATILSSIVKFEDNFTILHKMLCGFNPRLFLNKYHSDKGKLVNTFCEQLGCSREQNKLISRYSETLFDGANYFAKFKSKNEVISDLKKRYYKNDYKNLINYFLCLPGNRRIKGFSIALCCDFLKEFDATFDLPKPDIHIRDVMSAYYPNKKYNSTSKKQTYKCIDDFLRILSDINEQLSTKITAYQLDRMIWLCCTGNFFLDKVKSTKEYIIKHI